MEMCLTAVALHFDDRENKRLAELSSPGHTRLDEWEAGNANVQFVIGISRIFGIPGLVRVSPVSAPRIN